MNIETMAFEIWIEAKNKPGGLTINLEKQEITSGLPVGYLETQNSFELEGLIKCIKHAIDHDGMIGWWKNDDERIQFDSVKIFEDPVEAIKFGRENKQIAIWWLDQSVEIRL